MNITIIENRIREYQPINKTEELNALKEIAQELALSALSRAGFFKSASFLGGTCLRILYGLPRFSEDLDFSLVNINPLFTWEPYLTEIKEEFSAYGLHLETLDRSETNSTLRRAFLKEDSFGKVLQLTYPRSPSDKKVIRIKLEIDTQPPPGAQRAPSVLPFPIPYSIIAHDLPSLFAGKLNAILTRGFDKGRDWFDLLWYISRKETVNLTYLREALLQFSFPIPKNTPLSKKWIKDLLKEKTTQIDWQQLQEDLSGLLRERDQPRVALWDAQLFNSIITSW